MRVLFTTVMMSVLPSFFLGVCVAADQVGFMVKEVQPYGLETEAGKMISLSELLWVSEKPKWVQVRQKQVFLDQTEFGAGVMASNRYGDLQGKVLMPPFGWMQKYWLEQGMAVFSGNGPYPEGFRKQLIAAETEARENSRGKWAYWHIVEATDLQSFNGHNQFWIVEGKVRSVRVSRGTSYLNFGEDWKTDFTAAISSKNKSIFRRLDWKIADLENKWIRVRGQVRHYNGPFMELVFPEQVELLDQRPE